MKQTKRADGTWKITLTRWERFSTWMMWHGDVYVLGIAMGAMVLAMVVLIVSAVLTLLGFSTWMVLDVVTCP